MGDNYLDYLDTVMSKDRWIIIIIGLILALVLGQCGNKYARANALTHANAYAHTVSKYQSGGRPNDIR